MISCLSNTPQVVTKPATQAHVLVSQEWVNTAALNKKDRRPFYTVMMAPGGIKALAQMGSRSYGKEVPYRKTTETVQCEDRHSSGQGGLPGCELSAWAPSSAATVLREVPLSFCSASTERWDNGPVSHGGWLGAGLTPGAASCRLPGRGLPGTSTLPGGPWQHSPPTGWRPGINGASLSESEGPWARH